MENKQFFIYIEEIEKLEKEHKWDEVVSLLNNKINDAENRKEYIIRLIAQYLFMLVDWDIFDFGTTEHFFEIKKQMIDLYKSTKDEFKDDDKYLFIIGYFTYLFPCETIMCDDNQDLDYGKIQDNAKEMLKKAYHSNKNNLLYKFHYLFFYKSNFKYADLVKKRLTKQNIYYFPNNSSIEEYFRDVTTFKK